MDLTITDIPVSDALTYHSYVIEVPEECTHGTR